MVDCYLHKPDPLEAVRILNLLEKDRVDKFTDGRSYGDLKYHHLLPDLIRLIWFA